MDTANGGVMSHGGFHRAFGGHSVLDMEIWKDFGFQYPIELSKDFYVGAGYRVYKLSKDPGRAMIACSRQGLLRRARF